MIEWKIQEHIFHQTILTNWIDPKTTSAMSQQKINLVGTKGRFQSDQKDRGIELVTDSSNLEVPNPDFCRQYGVKRGEAKWLGYGIESITTFLDDVIAIIDGSMKPSMFEGLRPTFKESLISTSVLESASKSLYNNGNWYEVDIFD